MTKTESCNAQCLSCSQFSSPAEVAGPRHPHKTNRKLPCTSALVAASPADLQMVLGPGDPGRTGGDQQAHVQHKRLLTGAAVGQDSRQQQGQHCHIANSLRLGVGAVHCPESLHMGTGSLLACCEVRLMYDLPLRQSVLLAFFV